MQAIERKHWKTTSTFFSLLLSLVVVGFIGPGANRAEAQTPSHEDYLPKNVTATHNPEGNQITVTWDAPTAVWNSQSTAAYWVRYRFAGTYDYFDIDFDPGTGTTQTILDCTQGTGLAIAASAGVACIPIEKGKTYVVEVAQRSQQHREIDRHTVPTQTDADWAKVWREVRIDYNRDEIPQVTTVGIHNFAQNYRVNEGGPTNNLGVVITLDNAPSGPASVQVIWDEFHEFPEEVADLGDIRFTNGNVASDWTFGGSEAVQAFLPFEVVDDNVVETERETLFLRLTAFTGINPALGPRQASILIIDNDRTSDNLSVTPPEVHTVGLAEQVSDIELVSTLTAPVSSRCELSWSLDLAGSNERSSTKLNLADFTNLSANSGSFVFEAGETRATQTLSLADDGVPEGIESSKFDTGDLSCAQNYGGSKIQRRDLNRNITVLTNDVPVVSSVTAGDSAGRDTDREATLEWGLGGADEAEIVGFQIRWGKEVAGEDDAYHLVDGNVAWETLDVSKSSARLQVFPAVGRLDSGTTYVVQVGAITGPGAVPVYSETLSRVTTSSVVAATLSTVTVGDANGADSDRAATVNWDLIRGTESEISGFAVRWTEEVAGQDDVFYLTDPTVMWERVLASASNRSQLIPDQGTLTADTTYVVQVGIVLTEGENPDYLNTLGRVTVGSPISATVSVTSDTIFEGESFEIIGELSAALSEVVSVSVELTGDGTASSADTDDYEAGSKLLTFAVGETTGGSVSFFTEVDDDTDEETLVLSISSSDVALSADSVELSISELAEALPLPTDLEASPGGGSPLRDSDRAFSASWTAPSGVMDVSYEVGWVEKPTDGSVPADDMWETSLVNETSGVFPADGVLYRASNPTESGTGLTAGITYYVRVRSDLLGTAKAWSSPVEVAMEAPITATNSIDLAQVDEGQSVTLTVTLDRPLSEDLEVTWGLISAESPNSVAGRHTAEADDVTLASTTSTLAAGELSVEQDFVTVRDTDSDDEVFGVFATFGGDVVVGEIQEVTITDLDPPPTSSGGSGGSGGGGSGGSVINFPTGGGTTQTNNFNINNDSGTVVITQDNVQIGGFIDAVGTTHETNINLLAEGGITRGCNPPANTLFCPGRAVTRGEMATFMVRAFSLSESGSNLFGDDDGNTHESNINALAAAEITRGCNPPENTRYCPDRPVTRAQMATFLARAMELAEGSGDFSDTSGSPHANDINRIASVGITQGCNPPTNSRYCPDRAVTRGEMATFLTRAEDVSGK